MSSELDNVLSGIIVLLLIIVVWKWYNGRSSCDESNMTLSCGCRKGYCRCRGMASVTLPQRGRCPGGNKCGCGCPSGRCGCDNSCPCQRDARLRASSGREGMSNDEAERRVVSAGPIPPAGDLFNQDYSEVTKEMALESGSEGPSASHKRWCDSLMLNGMATGASSCTILEETGRSYGTSDYVGLTARKFCKARQLAAPAEDARQTASHTNDEYCNVEMNELV